MFEGMENLDLPLHLGAHLQLFDFLLAQYFDGNFDSRLHVRCH